MTPKIQQTLAREYLLTIVIDEDNAEFLHALNRVMHAFSTRDSIPMTNDFTSEKLAVLRAAIREGLASGPAEPFDIEAILADAPLCRSRSPIRLILPKSLERLVLQNID